MADLFSRLGLDWKLLLFQVVNFLILLFILKKIFYKPILKFLDERQKKIEDGLEKSKKFTEEWLRIQDIKREELDKAEREAVLVIEKARNEAEEKAKEILEIARQKTEKLVAEAKAEIGREKEKISGEIKKEISEYVIIATEKVLKRTLKEGDERKIAKETIESLK